MIVEITASRGRFRQLAIRDFSQLRSPKPAGYRKLEYIVGNLMFEPWEKTQKLHENFEKMPSTA